MSREIPLIEEKIKKIDEQIAALTELKSRYAGKLNCLSSEKSFISKPIDNIQSPNNRALLLKEYFHGREDVYAKLWINNRTAKRGYEIKEECNGAGEKQDFIFPD